jgi:hypothetical protein
MATKDFDVAKAWEQVKKETIKNKPNSDKPKPKRFKHEGHKGHEGRPLIKLCVLRVLCV